MSENSDTLMKRTIEEHVRMVKIEPYAYVCIVGSADTLKVPNTYYLLFFKSFTLSRGLEVSGRPTFA